jgi:hypothetical protein
MYVVILFTITIIIIIVLLNLGSILAYIYINIVLLSKDKVQATVIKYIDNVNEANATTRSIGIEQLNIRIREISKYKTHNTFIEYKEIINISEDILLRIYIMFLKYKYKVQNNIDRCVLRIASTPHRLQCHFDCRTSNLFMLYGKKRIVTFRLKEYSFNDQKRFMTETKNMLVDDLIKYLKTNKITHEDSLIHSGNYITLLPYQYHYVESMNDTSFTILLNLDNNDSNENTCKCDEAFEKHWPDAKWYSS